MIDLNVKFLLDIIGSGRFLSVFPEVTEEHLKSLEKVLTTDQTDQNYFKHFKIKDKSADLKIENDNLSLSNKWGVRLSNKSNSNLFKSPQNIRFIKDKFLISNKNLTESIPCVELDSNLNLKGYIGKIGTNIVSGEYNDAIDFTFNESKNKYYIASKSQNIIHIYNGTTKKFEVSIGTGIAGVDAGKITEPISLAHNSSYLFVACNNGSPALASGNGYIEVFNLSDNSSKGIMLYPGLNDGEGYCFQGEVLQPKDIKLVTLNGVEKLFVLNGNNEIGVWKTTRLANDNVLDFEDVYNIPSELGSADLGVSRIEVDQFRIYLTATNVGKIIAIDLKTKELAGIFGILKDESFIESKETLGVFNGLSGICKRDNTIYLSETLNNRIQSLDISLVLNNEMFVLYDLFTLPQNKILVDIAYSLKSSPVKDITIIDLYQNEFTVESAISRKLTSFYVKVKIDPSIFRKDLTSLKLEPIYILCESDY